MSRDADQLPCVQDHRVSGLGVWSLHGVHRTVVWYMQLSSEDIGLQWGITRKTEWNIDGNWQLGAHWEISATSHLQDARLGCRQINEVCQAAGRKISEMVIVPLL